MCIKPREFLVFVMKNVLTILYSRRSQCDDSTCYPLAVTQHVVFINIWSMTQVVFVFGSLTDTASISMHMCRLNFVQIVRKVFPTPLSM